MNSQFLGTVSAKEKEVRKWRNYADCELLISGGNTRIWTGESEFCRLVPYPLAMLPYLLLKKGKLNND